MAEFVKTINIFFLILGNCYIKFPRQYFCFTFEIEGLLREFVAFLMKRLHDCTLQSTDLVF